MEAAPNPRPPLSVNLSSDAAKIFPPTTLLGKLIDAAGALFWPGSADRTLREVCVVSRPNKAMSLINSTTESVNGPRSREHQSQAGGCVPVRRCHHLSSSSCFSEVSKQTFITRQGLNLCKLHPSIEEESPITRGSFIRLNSVCHFLAPLSGQ